MYIATAEIACQRKEGCRMCGTPILEGQECVSVVVLYDDDDEESDTGGLFCSFSCVSAAYVPSTTPLSEE